MLESYRRTGNPLDPNSVERKTWKFANFNFPLNEIVRVRISVDAQKKVSLSLFVFAIVGIQNLRERERENRSSYVQQLFPFKKLGIPYPSPPLLLTFLISAIISFGSLDDVVFMLHVNRRDLGFT